jgi:hypothetical protein
MLHFSDMTGVIKNKMTTILGIHLCLLELEPLLVIKDVRWWCI